VAGAFDRLRDAIFDPEPLREVLDLAHFTGREWVIREIDQYIATHDRGYVVVQAEAGVGKSALAAHLAFTRPCVYHFTRLEGARSPEQARRNLAAQLIGQWRLHDMAPGDAFPSGAGRPDSLLKVIRAAIAQRNATGVMAPLVVVVDGLDEAESPAAGHDTGIPLGLPRPEHLPVGRRQDLLSSGHDRLPHQLAQLHQKPRADHRLSRRPRRERPRQDLVREPAAGAGRCRLRRRAAGRQRQRRLVGRQRHRHAETVVDQ
jgi:hypothetical protein